MKTDYDKMKDIGDGLTSLQKQYGVPAVLKTLGFELEEFRRFIRDGAASIPNGDIGSLATGVVIGAVLYGECTIDDLFTKLSDQPEMVV